MGMDGVTRLPLKCTCKKYLFSCVCGNGDTCSRRRCIGEPRVRVHPPPAAVDSQYSKRHDPCLLTLTCDTALSVDAMPCCVGGAHPLSINQARLGDTFQSGRQSCHTSLLPTPYILIKHAAAGTDGSAPFFLSLFCFVLFFVNQLGAGVKDFFYEPAEGLMKSPTAFGKGVAKGTMSLVGNTTSGVLGFTTKIT